MANNYLLFSTMIPCKTEAQIEWLLARLGEPGEEDYGPSCRFERETDGVWVYADESGDVERIAEIVCEFQRKFHIQKPWTMTWATTCSRPILDEFGGGGVLCYKGKATFIDAGSWLQREKERLLKREKKGKR